MSPNTSRCKTMANVSRDLFLERETSRGLANVKQAIGICALRSVDIHVRDPHKVERNGPTNMMWNTRHRNSRKVVITYTISAKRWMLSVSGPARSAEMRRLTRASIRQRYMARNGSYAYTGCPVWDYYTTLERYEKCDCGTVYIFRKISFAIIQREITWKHQVSDYRTDNLSFH